MKKLGAVMDFTQQRDEELWGAYKSALRTAQYIFLPDIWLAVASMPCSRLWVSEERALAVVQLHRAGRQPLGDMRPQRRRLFAEVLRRVAAADPALPLKEAVWRAVHAPAEEFYLSPWRVQRLIYQIKHRRRRERDRGR